MSEILTQAQVLRHVADNLDAGRADGHGLQLNGHEGWNDVLGPLTAIRQGLEIRLKPRTRMLNGFEVPAPLDVMPEVGDRYWTIKIHTDKCAVNVECARSESDYNLFDRGFMFSSKKDAVANFNAICGIDPNEGEQ